MRAQQRPSTSIIPCHTPPSSVGLIQGIFTDFLQKTAWMKQPEFITPTFLYDPVYQLGGRALLAIMKRPWFTRRWVIKESTTATPFLSIVGLFKSTGPSLVWQSELHVRYKNILSEKKSVLLLGQLC
jgi:hypothetical protein